MKAGETIDMEEWFGKPKPAKTSPNSTPTKKAEPVPKPPKPVKPMSAKAMKKAAKALTVQQKLIQQQLIQQQLLQQKPLPIHAQLANQINFAQLLPNVPLAFNLYNQVSSFFFIQWHWMTFFYVQ